MEPIFIVSAGLFVSVLSGLLTILGPRLLQRLRRSRQRHAPYEISVSLLPPVIRIRRAGREAPASIEPPAPAVQVEPELHLSKQDMEKLRRQFRDELRKEGRKTFWVGFLQGAFFFALGVVATWLFS